MTKQEGILTDSFGRAHTYLRISLTELCNLRCTYCMPEEGVKLSPRDHIMNYSEIYELARLFVKHGVRKIRLTGGEPLVRKEVEKLILSLSELPVELDITTNGVLVDKFIPVFKAAGMSRINLSLDTLNPQRFQQITRRDHFHKVIENLQLLLANEFRVKVNVVLMKGFNDDEIVDFVDLTRELPVSVRFIEFMPFQGNKWDKSQLVSYDEILDTLVKHYGKDRLLRLTDAPNDTAKNYKVHKHRGEFAVISTITNPFCDSCNRLRLTANGHLKNCLFSAVESDLLTPFRAGQDIEPVIAKAVQRKMRSRGGMDTRAKIEDPELHDKNRSMISIGG